MQHDAKSIADHVRVKLARAPGQPATAESFGNLASMSRTPAAHIGKFSVFTQKHPTETDYFGMQRTVMDDTQSVRNSPSTLHFVAHHPDQITPLYLNARTGSRSVTLQDRSRERHEGETRMIFDRTLTDQRDDQEIDHINSGQALVRRLVGIPQRSDGDEPAVFFKSHKKAHLAALLTGGHVESVAFSPKRVASFIKMTNAWHPTGYNANAGPSDFIYDARSGAPMPDYRDLERRGVNSIKVMGSHPDFGEYITSPEGLIYTSSLGENLWLNRETHRHAIIHSTGSLGHLASRADMARHYGDPPTHFDPGVLDDTGRELHSRVVASPGDHLARAVLADHLDNMGHHEHADNWRQTLPLKFAKKKPQSQDVSILTPELGINVNDKSQAFTEQILSGAKTIETRNAPTLHPYIGKKMGLVRTGKGKAMLVGYVTIGEPKLYTTGASFDKDYDAHLVDKKSPFHISKSKKGSKWGYSLTGVERVEPRLLVDGAGVAPNPRVARKLSKAEAIADRVRVKLARTPSQPATAESFGSLWHMARTEPNHYLEARNWTGGQETFRKSSSKMTPQLPPSHSEVVNDPTVLHFVAHHPDQLSAPEFPTVGSTIATLRDNGPLSFKYNMRGFPDNESFSGIFHTSFEDDINQRYNHAQMNEQVSNGHSRVADLLGLAPKRFANETQPTVFFKSHRSAKLAAMLTGGHVETVAFSPKNVAQNIARSLTPRYARRRGGLYMPDMYDLRNRQLTDQERASGLNDLLSPNAIMQHPVFGEYITKIPGENSSSTTANDYDWIDMRNTHREKSLRVNEFNPSDDLIRGYGHPPLHFHPDVLDDVGRELHAQVLANPGDHLARAVLADHLDNMGHHEHADNWRQTLPLKFRKSGAPVRYAADEDEPGKFVTPSTNPASTSFGTAKNWVKANDPHPIWHNQRGGEHNVGVVDHSSHGDERLSAIHFIAGHPAQMSPVSFLDPSSNYPAQMKVMGVLSPHMKETSSAFPVARYNFHGNGETSHAPGRYQSSFTMGVRGDERDFSRHVYNSALSTNSAVLNNLGITSHVMVNGHDFHSRFTPMFKDREAAERMADQVGGYVQTIHFDPSRLRARGKPIEEVWSSWYGNQQGMEDIHDPDQFQVIDSRDNPSSQRLDGSIVNIGKHPDYGEYLITHNQSHLTSGPSWMRDTHFAGSLDKIDRNIFGSSKYPYNLSNPGSMAFAQRENQKNYFTPLISQYWRNLIDLHSDFHSNDFEHRRDLSAVLNNAGIDHTPPTRQLINSMGDAAQHLYAMALADRNDHMPRMVLADMFDEHGHDGAANFMRASIPHHVRRQLKLAKNADDMFHTIVWHSSESDQPVDRFDASKASKTAIMGPAFYFSQSPNRWNPSGSSGVSRQYAVGGKIIDLTKPLEKEHAEAIYRALGRHSEAPLLALERKFGSASEGLKAAGFDGAWHAGPGGKTDLAMFNPDLIRPATDLDHKRVKLAKDPNKQSVAREQIAPGSPEETMNRINELLAWPGETPRQSSQQPQQSAEAPKQPAQPQAPQYQRGDAITFRQYNNRIYDATYGRRLDESESMIPGPDWHEVYKKGESSPTWIPGSSINPQQSARSKDFSDNPPQAGDVIRIDSSLSGDRFHNGKYRVTPNHRGSIWHTNGREIRVEPIGNSPVNPSGFIPIRGRNYFMVNQAERQAPEPAEEQQQQPELIAPLRHPEIGPRLSFVDNAHKLETGDIIHTYFRYVDEDGEQHYRLLHSQPRMFVDIDDDRETFRSQRIHEDGTASNTHFSAPSAWNGSELPMFSLVQRAAETYRRVNSGLPELAEPGASPASAAPYLTPEQIADAHFNTGESVHVRDENGSTDVGRHSRIHLTPSGEIQHIVELGANLGEAAFNPEDVWHWYGASSRHKAFRSPESRTQVNDRLQSVSSGRRIWVDVVGAGSLGSHRRATLVGVNPDATISVRLDGKTDPIKVPLSRVKDNSDQSPPHVDMFDGSPISIIDAANGEVHHGVYRGSVRPNRNGQSVHDAILSAGLPYGENWTDPNRRPEDFVHVVEIRTPQGPLPVVVERRDLLPRFAQGVTHSEANEDPRSAATMLMKVASALEPTDPDEAARFRERAAELLTRFVRTINRPVVGGPALTAPQHTRSRSASSLSSVSAAPANAPPVEKKLERIIFNAGERNYDDVAQSLRDKFREMYGEYIDDQTIMDILRVPRAFPGADPNHPAFSPENLSLDLSIYSDNVSSTVRSKLPNYKFHASTSVGSGDASNRSQSHSGMKGTHDKFISTPHILQNQANAAHKLGISKLDVSAALTNPVVDPHNGYTGGIVWPTYGYTKDLKRIHASDWDDVQLAEAIAIARRNNPDLHAIDDSELTLNHLLDSKEGIDWYTQNEPHTYGGKNYLNATSGHMVFHTDPNSISHRILARKVRRLEQNAASRSNPS